MVATVIATRRAPSTEIGARDTPLDGARTVAPGLTAPPTWTPGLTAPPIWAHGAVGIMRIAAMIESLPSIIKSSLGTDDRPSLRFEVYQLVRVSAINTPPKVPSKLIGHGTG
jgi:hypothetical protein